MAKKKKNNVNANSNEGETKEQEEKTKGGDGGGEGGDKNKSGAVVLKVEMHCDGCASKIVRCAREFDGVESVKADSGANKLTVTGKVDPSKIRDYLHRKTKKKVDLISPQPKKEDTTNNNNNKDDKKPNNKKPDTDKKPKEAPVTTAVLKLGLHCQGCIKKIHNIVSKTKGVHEVALDKQKETVMVKGTMDVKSLMEALKERLKRPVELVPPKKEKEKEGGEADKDGEKTVGKKGGGGDKDREKTGGKKGGGDGEQEIAVMQAMGAAHSRYGQLDWPIFGDGHGGRPVYGDGYMGRPVYGDGYMGRPVYGDGHLGRPVYGDGYTGQPVNGYGYEYGYGHGPVPGYPAHMQFNDENPSSCSIM